jgi:glycosyltransferase involved in cell wall biosynthesis
MACGRACVGTDVAGTRDVLDDGVTGVLCNTDAAAIRDAVGRVMADPDLRDRLGEQAREEIVERYSLAGVVAAETALYRRLTT